MSLELFVHSNYQWQAMPKLCGMERRQMSMYENTEDASKVEKIVLLNIFHTNIQLMLTTQKFPRTTLCKAPVKLPCQILSVRNSPTDYTDILNFAYTVIRSVWVSAKIGTCTVLSVNVTLAEAKMCTFTLDLCILSSTTSVPYTLTTAQVQNLELTHKKRITV